MNRPEGRYLGSKTKHPPTPHFKSSNMIISLIHPSTNLNHLQYPPVRPRGVQGSRLHLEDQGPSILISAINAYGSWVTNLNRLLRVISADGIFQLVAFSRPSGSVKPTVSIKLILGLAAYHQTSMSPPRRETIIPSNSAQVESFHALSFLLMISCTAKAYSFLCFVILFSSSSFSVCTVFERFHRLFLGSYLVVDCKSRSISLSLDKIRHSSLIQVCTITRALEDFLCILTLGFSKYPEKLITPDVLSITLRFFCLSNSSAWFYWYLVSFHRRSSLSVMQSVNMRVDTLVEKAACLRREKLI